MPQWKETIVSIWKDASCTATHLLLVISLTSNINGEQQISGFRKFANISNSVKVKVRYTEVNIMETLGYKSNCRQYHGDRKKA